MYICINAEIRQYYHSMIVFPNAKINVGLRIINRRNDGFHNIESLMVPVKLADALEVTPSADGQFGFTASGIPVEGDVESNLCVLAFRLMQKYYRLPEVKIHLHKVIPVGAGLGGGSADAAFTLKLLNRVFSLKLCNNDLRKIAEELGSDCSFFIENRPCFASGRGEELKPVNIDFGKLHLLIVKPDISVSTIWAYSQVKPSGRQLPGTGEIINQPSRWNTIFENDFEQVVFEAWPEIAAIKRQIIDLGAIYTSMSGSGSSVFGLFEKQPDYHGLFKGNFVWEGMAG